MTNPRQSCRAESCGCVFVEEDRPSGTVLIDGKLCVAHALQQAGETLRKAGVRMLEDRAAEVDRD